MSVSPSLAKLRLNKQLMAYTAAAMYGGAAFDGSIEGLLPGDPSFAVAPVFVAIARDRVAGAARAAAAALGARAARADRRRPDRDTR